jgi:hypothetical protein
MVSPIKNQEFVVSFVKLVHGWGYLASKIGAFEHYLVNGMPDASKRHVRFNVRRRETERCRMAQATAPILVSR